MLVVLFVLIWFHYFVMILQYLSTFLTPLLSISFGALVHFLCSGFTVESITAPNVCYRSYKDAGFILLLHASVTVFLPHYKTNHAKVSLTAPPASQGLESIQRIF